MLSRIFLLLSFVLPLLAYADVTLNNGTTVPTDSMIVYILLGHSNMSGRADEDGTTNVDSINTITSIYHDEDPMLWSYAIQDMYNATTPTGVWVPAVWRIRNDFDSNPNWVGPGMPILKKLRDYYPKHHIGVIQVATGFAQLKLHFIDDKNDYGAKRWTQLSDAITGLKGKVRFGGVITMLGIVEVNQNLMAPAINYRTDLDTLITRIRNLADDQTIPLLASDLEQGDRKSLCAICSWYVDTPVGDTITKRIVQAEAEIPFTRMINTMWSLAGYVNNRFPLFRDDHHYNRVGMLKFADATIDALLQETSITPYCSPGDLSCIPVPLSSTSSSSSSNTGSSSSAAGPAFTFTSPSAGSTVQVGDTLSIQWQTDLKQVVDAYPQVSLDAGRSWLSIGITTSVLPGDPLWQNIPWVVPATMVDMAQQEVTLTGRSLRIRLITYTGTATATVQFSVEAAPSTRNAPLALGANLQLRNNVLFLQSPEPWQLQLSNLLGQPLLAQRGVAGNFEIALQGFPSGLYSAQINHRTKLIYVEP